MNVEEKLVYFRKIRVHTTNKLANDRNISEFLRDVESLKKNITFEYLSVLVNTLKIRLKDFF